MPDEPTKLEGNDQPAGQIDVEALLGELAKVNVADVEDLKGRLNAGSQAGHLANLLGEVRKENAELKEMLKNVQTQPAQKLNLDAEGQTINLEGVLENVVSKVLTKKEQETTERQQRLQRAITEAIGQITNDEDYPLVKEAWERQMTPDVIFKIQTGQINPIKLYEQTVRRHLKDITKKSLDAINMLSGKGKTAIPHTEKDGNLPTNLVSSGPSKENPASKRLTELKTQVDKGKILSDQEELEMANLILMGGKAG